MGSLGSCLATKGDPCYTYTGLGTRALSLDISTSRLGYTGYVLTVTEKIPSTDRDGLTLSDIARSLGSAAFLVRDVQWVLFFVILYSRLKLTFVVLVYIVCHCHALNPGTRAIYRKAAMAMARNVI